MKPNGVSGNSRGTKLLFQQIFLYNIITEKPSVIACVPLYTWSNTYLQINLCLRNVSNFFHYEYFCLCVHSQCMDHWLAQKRGIWRFLVGYIGSFFAWAKSWMVGRYVVPTTLLLQTSLLLNISQCRMDKQLWTRPELKVTEKWNLYYFLSVANYVLCDLCELCVYVVYIIWWKRTL